MLQRSRVNQSIVDTSIEFEDNIGQNEHSILKVRNHGVKSYLDLQVCALERKPRDGQRLGVFGLTVHTRSIFNYLAVYVERVRFKEHNFGSIGDQDVHQELGRLAGVHVDLNRVETNLLEELRHCYNR